MSSYSTIYDIISKYSNNPLSDEEMERAAASLLIVFGEDFVLKNENNKELVLKMLEEAKIIMNARFGKDWDVFTIPLDDVRIFQDDEECVGFKLYQSRIKEISLHHVHSYSLNEDFYIVRKQDLPELNKLYSSIGKDYFNC